MNVFPYGQPDAWRQECCAMDKPQKWFSITFSQKASDIQKIGYHENSRMWYSSMFCPEGHFIANVNSHNSLLPCGYKLTIEKERDSVPNFRRQRAGSDQHCGVWFQRLEYISRVFENRHVKVQELPKQLLELTICLMEENAWFSKSDKM